MSGKLFVIEGLDGSGKQTQSELLFERLKSLGYPIRKVSYPNYKSQSSALVQMYLRGDFGKNPDEISPYISSTFYAADRYASYKTEYEDFYKNGGIIISDRYTTSNMVHQASKIKNVNDKNKFLDWLWDFEFNLYGIPVPTQVIFLDIPPKISIEWMSERKNKFSKESEKDIHESCEDHLISSYENANYLIDKYNWERVNCIENEKALSIELIHERVFHIISEYLNS